MSDITCWAQGRSDIEAVVLVGSYARGRAGMASDLDIVILTRAFAELADDPTWFLQVRPGSKLIRCQRWGPLLELRYRLRSGLQVEFGLVSPSWAALPLDSGTRRVLSDGHRTLYDRGDVIAQTQTALARPPTTASPE
jgi:uncharacterized protein